MPTRQKHPSFTQSSQDAAIDLAFGVLTQANTATGSITSPAAEITGLSAGCRYRMLCTVDAYVSQIAAGGSAVTSAGVYIPSMTPEIISVPSGKTSLSVLRVGTVDGTIYLTKLENVDGETAP